MNMGMCQALHTLILHMDISGSPEDFGAGSGTGNGQKITTTKCSLC